MAPRATRVARLWKPKRVLVTRFAYERDHGRAIVARSEAAGVADIVLLTGDRLPALGGDTARAELRTREVHPGRGGCAADQAAAAADPALRRLALRPRGRLPRPLPVLLPRRLAAGPPVTRAYANLDAILGNLAAYAGRGAVTSAPRARATRAPPSRPPATPTRSASSPSPARSRQRSGISVAPGTLRCSCA